MKIIVDEVFKSTDELEKKKNILVRLSGNDIKFIATEYSLSFYLDNNLADKLAFQLTAILEDRYRRKELTK